MSDREQEQRIRTALENLQADQERTQRLHDAAEQMLVALREIVQVTSGPTATSEGAQHALNECLYLARAAIRKAEGDA